MLHFLMGCDGHLKISKLKLWKASVQVYMSNSFPDGPIARKNSVENIYAAIVKDQQEIVDFCFTPVLQNQTA